MHIALESRREHRRTGCRTDYWDGKKWSHRPWTGAGRRRRSAALERSRRRTVGLYSRSPTLWMNVAPSEWSVSVPAMPTHGSRRDPELPRLPHAQHACVRRNREHEDRWLICTRFTYARAGCYVGTKETTDIEMILEITFTVRDSSADRKRDIFI